MLPFDGTRISQMLKHPGSQGIALHNRKMHFKPAVPAMIRLPLQQFFRGWLPQIGLRQSLRVQKL
jgi:hypothetical protein